MNTAAEPLPDGERWEEEPAQAAAVSEPVREVTPAAPRDAPDRHPDGRLLDRIEGVVYRHAHRYVDHRGSLIELINTTDSFWSEPIVHAEYVTLKPGRIKGWGMHKLSTDRYFGASGHVRTVLYDGRRASPTYQCFAQFHLTEDSPGFLRIPPGVWHANQNWGEGDATLLIFPTRPHDPVNRDKYRIDPHSGLISFDWTLRDG